jgi:hypothetical protein
MLAETSYEYVPTKGHHQLLQVNSRNSNNVVCRPIARQRPRNNQLQNSRC